MSVRPKKVVTLTNTKVVDVCDVNRFRNPTTTASCCRQVSEGTSAPLQLREQPIVVWPRRSEWAQSHCCGNSLQRYARQVLKRQTTPRHDTGIAENAPVLRNIRGQAA